MKRVIKSSDKRRRGFTMMELLAVMVIISMLIGISITAAQWVFRTLREKRYVMTCRILETAINRYHHEYREWPIPLSGGTYSTTYKVSGGKYDNPDYTYKFSGENNKECLSMLRRLSDRNPKRIPFIDESGLFAMKNGKMLPLPGAGDEAVALAYRNRKNKVEYYSVTIDVEAEKVSVE